MTIVIVPHLTTIRIHPVRGCVIHTSCRVGSGVHQSGRVRVHLGLPKFRLSGSLRYPIKNMNTTVMLHLGIRIRRRGYARTTAFQRNNKKCYICDQHPMFWYDGHSGGVTPGPIPNPAVKSAHVSVCTVLRERTGTRKRCQPLLPFIRSAHAVTVR